MRRWMAGTSGNGVLSGTNMRAVAHAIGLKYSPLPPYEVMLTDAMSPCELLTAMQLFFMALVI